MLESGVADPLELVDLATCLLAFPESPAEMSDILSHMFKQNVHGFGTMSVEFRCKLMWASCV